MATRHDPAALAGMRLGTCVLETPLGTGGMGAVYLARQERPKRMVAVKVVHQQLTGDPQAWRVFLARFRREADATAALDSANIMPIYEFGEQQGVAYLVMPYLSDGSLAQLLEREGPLPLTRVVRYLEQAASALDLAHRHGIIHRDVKPSNLLLHPDGRLLLGDFGIARAGGAPELLLTGLGDGNPAVVNFQTSTCGGG
ncbi:MAG: serine/threonine-protein kinase [Ktedonobacterales bacterium]